MLASGQSAVISRESRRLNFCLTSSLMYVSSSALLWLGTHSIRPERPFCDTSMSSSLHSLLEWTEAMMHDLLRQVSAACCSPVHHMKTTDALVIATQVAVKLSSLI